MVNSSANGIVHVHEDKKSICEFHLICANFFEYDFGEIHIILYTYELYRLKKS